MSAAAQSAMKGTGIGRGVAVGPVARMSPPPLPPPAEPSLLTHEQESQRVTEAIAAVTADLTTRGQTAGGQAQEVLDAQVMMAQDPTVQEAVETLLAQGQTGEYAVHTAFAEMAETLQALGGYLGERAADLHDVAARVVAALRGDPPPGVPDPGHPFVLVAQDLAPADTALLDLDKVLALVTIEGGPTSHTAILARGKGITAVVGVAEASRLADGDEVIVDAANSTIVVSPTQEQRAEAAARVQARAAAQAAPLTDGALADGTPVPLLANLGTPESAAEAVQLGAEGVGLFRTEFLFLSSESAPSVEAQRKAYQELLEAFPGKKVVVRALDAGADKPLPFLNDAEEENPALGLRGLRALLTNEEVLRDQLSALAQAQEVTSADLWVMAPMVSTVEETETFAKFAHQHGLKTAGVMVEVPSSALLAEQILKTADFASIGTNDLTQYTMAADRLLGSVAGLQDPWHPAVLKLVREVGAAGTVTGKPVGVCGEAAADPLLAVVLVGLGVTSLSMAPAALADVRAELLRFTKDQARAIATAAVSASTAAEALQAAQHTATTLTNE
ncbi:phosphoenolpyruvate--protein phosphotransferase [Nesterenkonia sphaerica]|uniref:Phosphoenolpyruvate-protein phosphotransferase n=1 Tax=Nesterenkonia sphaerica TaxID=1804988 RepID=A0A5R9AG75_9MICC|nr:phosphoenolpyruvate--protein phosphotransferase [Nesterenkonia sphaerica]TLP77154.1 phosphoenolpyruvate--protein phosphotransferase [Nesterenkonia sphaerica]